MARNSFLFIDLTSYQGLPDQTSTNGRTIADTYN